MRRRSWALSAVVGLWCVAGVAGGREDTPKRLPRVLLIGDSISIGYTKAVQQLLSGKAHVRRIRGNAQHTGTGLEKLGAWLGKGKWDVIHFNWGLWDLCYRNPKSKMQGHRDKVNGTLTTTLKQYEKNLTELVGRLKATEARLIWAATTPVPDGEAGRIKGDDLKYNAVAAKIMAGAGVTINDLHAHIAPKADRFAAGKGDVHFTPEGYRFLAEKVAASVLAALGKEPPAGRRQPSRRPPSVPADVVLDTATQQWRDSDDVIDGWDWSLPPGIKPVASGGLKFSGAAPAGYSGRRLYGVNWTWRQIEPREGVYEFEPLRQAIRKAAKKGGVELHVRGSVWELRDFHDKAKYPKGWPRSRDRNASAPRWLKQYGIPLIEEKPKTNIATPFQVVNMDIYHRAYHERYMKMVRALGHSGIPKMPEVTVAMVHVKSGSRGEEGHGPESGPGKERFEQRLRAWAEAFGESAGKLCYVGHKGSHLDLAYRLGMGQRCGFVEMYLMHVDNPQLGQRIDEQGYLTVDESCPPIADRRAFGDENEEYAPAVHVPRFGPMTLWPHRYRESMLRALQMRRSFLWAEPNPWVNPPLLNYVGLSLGRCVKDTPDAWCSLRRSVAWTGKARRTVKNFERWLYQRDRDGFRTAPAVKVAVAERMIGHARGHKYDYIARRTDSAAGQKSIGLALDDRFLSGGPHKATVKVTYHDVGRGKWALVCSTAADKARRAVQCKDTGKVRTATFHIDEAIFPAKGMGFDLTIEAAEGDATVSFVRIIKR